MQTYSINQSLIGISAVPEDSGQLLACLTDGERYALLTEKMTEKRKREWLAVRVLLKKMLAGEEKEILYLPSGKPYLADHSQHIGISHTDGYVALILNRKKEAAIDIEQISPRIQHIRRRFMSEEEEKAVSKKNELLHLLLHWSAKESLFKLLNEENVDFRQQLHIRPFRPVVGRWATFGAYETLTGNPKRYTVHYFIHSNYVLTCIG